MVTLAQSQAPCYNANMDNVYTSLRVTTETRRILKLAAALQETTIVDLVRRLAVAELARVQGKAIDTPSL